MTYVRVNLNRITFNFEKINIEENFEFLSKNYLKFCLYKNWLNNLFFVIYWKIYNNDNIIEWQLRYNIEFCLTLGFHLENIN